ncbi:ATP-binding protein [Hyalangium rubrum]|uniref:histidine kinase n=1 Tax=Hyalangium rubrum TaxID=3103134 RepID=A0ABU5GZD9_9BACT|nr:ATP-binding protein [Hyalangium sp. s54d21]MDY7226548.1 ATP-binding protein [Hyalangium sp. s54d21]
MSAPPPDAAWLPLWLLCDERGVVSTYGPGGEELLGLDPRGRTLAELFDAVVAQRLVSGPEDRFAWARPAAKEGAAPMSWRLERHRLEGGGLLVRAGPVKAATEEVPTAWERRIPRQPLHPEGNILEQQRAFMLALLDADPSLIFVKDRHGRFIFVNKALADSYSTTPDAMVLASNSQVHSNAQELKVFDVVDQRVLQTLTPVRVEESVTLRDESVIWYETHKRPLRAPNGETFVLGIAVDITERRRVEKLLHEANQRLEMAVRAGQLGLWDWDVAANTVYFSPAWKAQIGYEDAELPNSIETLTGHIHPEDLTRVLEAVGRHLQDPTKGDRYVNEFRMLAKDGTWRWIAGYALVLRDAAGAGVRATGFHVDITERKAQEEAQQVLSDNLRQTNEHLERLGRMKDEFLANMSHELRTPLNAVLGQSEAMGEGIFGPLTEEQRSSLRTIEESGKHLLSLINDVLDVTKSNAGHLELVFAPVPVEEVCQESLRLVREQARRKGLSLSYASDGQVVGLWGDRRRLRQVLLNLLSNAKKFTPEGGRIGLEVASAHEGAAVSFTVWDTGIGIADEDRQRIFEPFVQLDAGLARRHEGSGLGLALVRRLVELHHGTLTVESTLGKGSRFTVVLPVEPPAGSVTLEPVGLGVMTRLPTPYPLSAGRTVLIADDHEANTRHLEDYLKAHGFLVRIARDGEEAVRMCREMKPAVVLMDIQLPRFNGLEAIRHLRADATTAAVPMVALTALAMPGDRERCLAAGADAYLHKPVRLGEVLEVVNRLALRSAPMA